MLDRIIAGIGRIQRASGTHSTSELGEINAMITTFRRRMEKADADPIYRAALQALHDGKVTGVALLRAFHDECLREVVPQPSRTATPTVEETRAAELVDVAWEAWNAKTLNAATRRDRAYTLKRIQEVAPGPITVAELPGVLLLLRDRYAEQAPAFNRSRAAMLRFVRSRLSKVHPIYEALVGIDGMEETPTRRHAPSLLLAIAVRDALASKPAAIWWSMYLTGMNPLEYDGAWEIDGGAIHIHGTKRDARDRWVPHLGPVVRRTMGWKQYRAALDEVLALLPKSLRPAQGLQRNDARRGYRALLESARLLEPRIRLYMGHALDVSQNYGRPEAMAAVTEDAPTLRARLEAGEAEARKAQKRRMRTG